MARPNKIGLEYFPFDTVTDEKMKMIECQCNLEGFGILVHLLQRVYLEGYYLEWSERNQLLFNNTINIKLEKIQEIIDACLKWGIFDKNLYDKYNILTSIKIQKDYAYATERRKEVYMIREYVLLEPKDLKKIIVHGINEPIYSNNDDINTHSKEQETESTEQETENTEENKLKNSKLEGRIGEVLGEGREPFSEEYLNYIKKYFNDNCNMFPKIIAMTETRKKYLNEWGDWLEIKKVFDSMKYNEFLKKGNSEGEPYGFDYVIRPEHRTTLLKHAEELLTRNEINYLGV